MDRLLLASILALAAAVAVDALGRRRRLDPPAFALPHRRVLAILVLGLAFLIGVFAPAVHFDQPPEVDFASLEWTSAFYLQGLLLLALVLWYHLGYRAADGGPWRPPAPRRDDLEAASGDLAAPAEVPTVVPAAAAPGSGEWPRLFGLACRHLPTELGIGVVAGAGAWFVALTGATLVALVVAAFGGGEALAEEPPAMIVWMASLPVAARLAMSLSAGLVEELFFRGFLQPRVGIALSSLLFVLGHLGYGQPFMLVGLTFQSLFYAFLVRWRRNIWAAVVAHFLFDAVQLLVIIPAALEIYDRGEPAGLLLALGIC